VSATAEMLHDPTPAHVHRTATGVENLKLGMWLFLASEVMFFTGLVGSYVVLRLGSKEWPEPGSVLGVNVLAFNTFVLITSSVTMALGLQAARENDRAKLVKLLLATAGLGLTFLTIKLLDYRHLVHEGFTPTTNLFGSCYYMLTGFHGLHVFGGVTALSLLALKNRRGEGTVNASPIEAVGLYWHFVDLVWIVLFAILCLV
jgi:heme/copper-type cytochrome/quinol oxidase subunit 3